MNIHANKILFISNAPITKPIHKIIDQYDYIVRFNSGSNPKILQDNYELYGDRVDLCVISGYQRGFFGDIEHFKNKDILFHRMIKNKSSQYIFEEFTRYTDKINFIPNDVFNKFNDEYLDVGYVAPTTGLITIYYFCNILKLNITCLNFCADKNIRNYFLKKNGAGGKHEHEKELEIYNKIQCEKINSN